MIARFGFLGSTVTSILARAWAANAVATSLSRAGSPVTMRLRPSDPKIDSSVGTSNFSAAATNASAACWGVSNAFGFAEEVAGSLPEDWGVASMLIHIKLAAAKPQASHRR